MFVGFIVICIVLVGVEMIVLLCVFVFLFRVVLRKFSFCMICWCILVWCLSMLVVKISRFSLLSIVISVLIFFMMCCMKSVSVVV